MEFSSASTGAVLVRRDSTSRASYTIFSAVDFLPSTMTLFTTCWTSLELWMASGSMGRRPAAARRGICFLLLGLHAVLRACLPAVRDACGVERAANDLVANARKILDTAAA